MKAQWVLIALLLVGCGKEEAQQLPKGEYTGVGFQQQDSNSITITLTGYKFYDKGDDSSWSTLGDSTAIKYKYPMLVVTYSAPCSVSVEHREPVMHDACVIYDSEDSVSVWTKEWRPDATANKEFRIRGMSDESKVSISMRLDAAILNKNKVTFNYEPQEDIIWGDDGEILRGSDGIITSITECPQ